MTTFTAFNPWTGSQFEVDEEKALQSIYTFASVDECEAVNTADTDAEWIEAFINIHGQERFSDIVCS